MDTLVPNADAQMKKPNFMSKAAEKGSEKSPEKVVSAPQEVDETATNVVALITENFHVGKTQGSLKKGNRCTLPRHVALTLRDVGAVELLDR